MIRSSAPLVHSITNYVAMNATANALLALGASPVMAHAAEEVEEMVGLARALVLNIGTLSGPWLEAMAKAGKEALRRGIPVVLDPVGCGATAYRTDYARMLARELKPSIIRGNASEIRSLARSGQGPRGVDSRISPDEAEAEARELSASTGGAVSVSGAVDLVVMGESWARVANGHPLMARVTGMGCTASAVTAAFAAVNPSPFLAAAHAMAAMGIAGEMAAERAAGPGSFQAEFTDALYRLGRDDIERALDVRGTPEPPRTEASDGD
jgi:hydroxyethylthiazole kinase